MRLEEEFKRLMEEAMKEAKEKLKIKVDAGELDYVDSLELSTMFDNVLNHGDTSNYGEKCPDGHDDPDCGWSPSMGYHCT